MPGKYAHIYTTLVIKSLFLLGVVSFDAEDDDKEFDFSKLPGSNHELTVEIGALREDCFYQPIAKGANMYVYFEVVRGGDRKIDFVVRDPSYRILETQVLKTEGSMQTDVDTEGVYSICLDNTFSRFSSKLVMLFLYVTVHSDWTKFVEQIDELKNISGLIKTSLAEVESSISEMRRYQSRTATNVLRDWYLVTGNNSFIGYYSIIQCIVIVISACTQVYLLRRFFRTVKVTPNLKPRA